MLPHSIVGVLLQTLRGYRHRARKISCTDSFGLDRANGNVTGPALIKVAQGLYVFGWPTSKDLNTLSCV